MSFLAQCVTTGFAAVLRIAGEDVTYTREDVAWPLKLVPAEQSNPQETLHALNRGWTERDWQGLVSELDVAELWPPQPGDQIALETPAGIVEVYEVVSDREQCWQPVAGSVGVYQVHTLRTQQ